MLKSFFCSTIFFVVLGLGGYPRHALAQWYSMGELAAQTDEDRWKKPISVQKNEFFQHWIGDLAEVELVGKEGKGTGMVKIRMTHVSDRSPYACGQIVLFNMTELKEVTARAWAVKECR